MVKKDYISEDMIKEFSEGFNAYPQHSILMNAIIKNGINSVAIDYKSSIDIQYTFSTEIETGRVTNQKQSGRCWLFAGLNILRHKAAKKYALKDFELSQNYQMFWDKFEKANYFLESIVDTVEEAVDSRIVMWLLSTPQQDGGQWDMFANLVKKYGVVPKSIMPETYHSSQTSTMNYLLNLKLRKDAFILRNLPAEDTSEDSLRSKKEEMLNEIYSLLCYFLGEPPKIFDFEYRDDKTDFFRDRRLTPIEFYKKYIDMDMDEYISIINAPTPDKPFNKTYTVSFLGNVKDGKEIKYVNVDIETLRSLTMAQLKDNEPVWFGCDVGKFMDGNTGILDTNQYHYELALNTCFDMSKGERLDYRESCLTHAMVITGTNIVDGKANRWKIENSWGEERGNKGYFVMSDSWFDEFTYQIVANKKYLSKELCEIYQQKPIELAPWDPMGSLAIML